MAGRNDKLGVQHVRQLAGKEEAEVDAGEVPEQVDGVPGGGVGAKQLVAEQVAKRTERAIEEAAGVEQVEHPWHHRPGLVHQVPMVVRRPRVADRRQVEQGGSEQSGPGSYPAQQAGGGGHDW